MRQSAWSRSQRPSPHSLGLPSFAPTPQGARSTCTMHFEDCLLMCGPLTFLTNERSLSFPLQPALVLLAPARSLLEARLRHWCVTRLATGADSLPDFLINILLTLLCFGTPPLALSARSHAFQSSWCHPQHLGGVDPRTSPSPPRERAIRVTPPLYVILVRVEYTHIYKLHESYTHVHTAPSPKWERAPAASPRSRRR